MRPETPSRSRALATWIAGAGLVAALVAEPSAHAAPRPHAAERGEVEMLTLSRAIELGKARAPELVAARARTEAADSQVSLGAAGYLPTLTATVTGAATGIRDSQPIPPALNTKASIVTYSASGTGALSLRWALLDFGKTSNTVAAAEGSRAAAVAGQKDAEANVTSDIASAYLGVVFRDQVRDVASSVLAQREKLLVLARALVKSGLQPAVEEIRAAARTEAARRDLVTAEADAADAAVGLATLLGLELKRPLRVTAPRLTAVEMDAAQAAQLGEERQASVLSARTALDSRRTAVDAAEAQRRPTLSLNVDGTYRFLQTDRADVLLDTRSASAALVLSGPLFDAAIGARVDSAKADVVAAEASLESARRDARSEAARAAVAVRTSASLVEHAKKTAEATAAVFAVIQARYAQGLSSPLELIEAEAEDSDARVARIRAELTHALAVVRLLAATGQARRIGEEGAS